MTFGRPMRLAKGSLHGTSPISTSSMAVSRKLEFFERYCQIHDILGDVLANFYTRSSQKVEKPRTQAQELDLLVHFDKRLAEWHAFVPNHLRIPESTELRESDLDSDRLIFARQAKVLHAGYVPPTFCLSAPFLKFL